MKVRMLALDLDGTLLKDDKTISGRTIRALTECREKGIKIVCATARGNIKIFVPDGLFDGHILKSGAIAHIGSNLVYSKTMRIEDVRPFLLAVNNKGLCAAVQNHDGIHYANFNVTEKWAYITNYKSVDFAAIDFDIDKIYVVTETPESVEFVKKHAPAAVHLFISRDDLTFLFHKYAVKSRAAAALAEYWGINPSETIAFGDDRVDIELLQNCGVGVAVGNALDEVKAVADYICDTNENDGVAKWLEENVLCRKS